jgi:membrane associated rhomboid family serine protease
MPYIPVGLKNLLIIMALIGLAQVALPRVGIDSFFMYLFYPDSPWFRPWQLITHIFCHGSISHFLFNGIALFSFGAIVEMRLGTQRFLMLFFLSALGAVALHFGNIAWQLYEQAGTIMPNHTIPGISVPYGPMVGASGAVYGVMVAFAMLYPNESLLFLFIPYPIKAKYLVSAMIGLDLLLALGQFEGDIVAHYAHLGGALVGLLFTFLWKRRLFI